MLEMTALEFEQETLISTIANASKEELDEMSFGVIRIDETGVVQRYNLFESKLAGLRAQNVIGSLLFTNVAPCMNNFMVAQRFEDALETGATLDLVIDYVLTLRMRPIRVKLRLLASPLFKMRYILVQRS